ncbi:hypothetical protein HPB51_024528 [Rhipicephalus microplus]|uniref:Uncharacterized protein n=1 Tax=Rhipicephalus microplus TaxID=6941 RepID=A0A9J6DQX5_RHIMP|nr:hypothetical protein HPB51_024528 [Rhipicephalus microplus]
MGEDLILVGRMSAENCTGYAKLEQALLQRFHNTEEGYHMKLRDAQPENDETGRQFVGRLCENFEHWQELAKSRITYDALRDNMLSEQFLRQCQGRLAVLLKKRGCTNLDTLTTTVD